MLMAHQDVVPIAEGTEKDWAVDPFAGTNLDNYTLPSEATGLGTILRAPLTAALAERPAGAHMQRAAPAHAAA